ncbi:MAG: hypothetical protein JXA93_13015 [Anaerolineae bacterium]|nr:hypothetical protein [Anaerolineae bacterium]
MEEKRIPQTGQSIVVVAIALLALLIFVAISVDMSSAYVGRRTAQNAADAAASAGVRQLAWQINHETFNDALVKQEMNNFGELNGLADTGGAPGDVVNNNVEGFYLDQDRDRIGAIVGGGVVPEDTWGIEAVTYITTPAFFGGIVGYDGYPLQARAAVMLEKACGADCVVPIATHVDTITATGCINIFNGSGPGNFGWLNWSLQGLYCSTGDCSARCLADNLAPGSCRSGLIEFGDDVAGAAGDMNSGLVRQQLKYYIDTPEEFTVVVYDTAQGTGCNDAYHVVGFARMQLLGYQLAQGGGNAYGHDGVGCIVMGQDPNDGVRLTAEFRGWVGGEGGNCRAIGTVRAPKIVE